MSRRLIAGDPGRWRNHTSPPSFRDNHSCAPPPELGSAGRWARIASNIDICNRTLLKVGTERIASFDDGAAESEAAAVEYEAAVREAQTIPGGAPFRWGFAQSPAVLARMEATLVGPSHLVRAAVSVRGVCVPDCTENGERTAELRLEPAGAGGLFALFLRRAAGG